MTQSQFIKIKVSGRKPVFKDLIALTESGETNMLLDFMRMLHTGKYTCISAQGSKGKVESDKGSFVYTIYNSHILKTDIYNENKTLYKR